MSKFDIIQTFFVDSSAVFKSSEVLLTSIELFFKEKPATEKNTSGSRAPGVAVYLCEVNNDLPDPLRRVSDVSYVSYENIFAFTDASTPTVFKFNTPKSLKTDRFYGIVISLEDPQFKLWINKQGDYIINSNVLSSGSNQVNDGKYYEVSSVEGMRALNDRDLKFKVNIAKYQANTLSQTFHNKEYEFFTVNAVSGSFRGGEYVFQIEANATGTIAIEQGNNTIVGNGTNFTALDQESYIVARSGSDYDVLRIESIVDNTHIIAHEPSRLTNATAVFYSAPVGRVVSYDAITSQLYLSESSANSTLKFDANSTVRGEISQATATIESIDNISVDKIYPKMTIETNYNVDTDIVFSVAQDIAGEFSNSSFRTLILDKENDLANVNAFILSRSNELEESGLANNKSLIVDADLNVNANTSNLFIAPIVNTKELDLFIGQALINSTTEVAGKDSEVGKNGTALAKYVSKRVNLEASRYAESIRVYLFANKPIGTDIKVYAKIHNSADSDAFDDKDWTPLKVLDNAERFSANKNDFIDFTFGFDTNPEEEVLLGGSFNTQLGNNIVTALEVNPSATLAAGDMVKIYSPLFPENYHVSIVNSANTSAVVLNTEIPDVNTSGSGFRMSKLKYPKAAFENARNDGIVRYYNSAYSIFDTYNSFQIKVVLLSDSTFVVPEVESIQAVAVSV